jgi:hypothetical protein
MRPLVKNEWRKFLYRIRRYGFDETTSYTCKRIAAGTCPLFFVVRYLKLLLKKGDIESASRIFRTARRNLRPHPLLDELYSSWLWCSGKKQAAIRVAVKQAHRWKRPYLYTQAAALYDLSGNERMAKRYFRSARVDSRINVTRGVK